MRVTKQYRILAVGDHVIPPVFFKEVLAELSCDHDVNVIELDESRKWRSPEEPISEYAGSPQQLIEVVGGYEAILVHNAPVTKDVIEKGENLKVIGCARGGPANVNVKAATRMGIPVVNAPGRNSISVAELTMGFILLLSKKILETNWRVKTGRLVSDPQFYEGREVFGKTLSLIGLGNVGREVAKRAIAFGMKVVAYDPYIDKEKANMIGVALEDDLEKVMRSGDFLSIHARLTKQTKGMIGEKLIDVMKPGSFLINTARGEIVDQEALRNALERGKIAGAALDVLGILGDYPLEPIEFCQIYKEKCIPENFIANLDNCVVTPHVGGQTREAKIRSVKMVVDELKKFIEGKKLENVVNPEVLT